MVTSIFQHLPLADFNSDWLLDHAGLLIAVVIVLITLAVGLGDLFRFSGKRIWAISSVCFAESIRRRVLWITPLAIIGVMVVCQLQRPSDEQDAVRQMTKFCLFTTGLVVVIVAILLASTSLPKEIDNRVIFTIVTKPTTRLEIVLGKTLGFARVSATILLIMGLFTSVYLQFRSWNLEKDIALRLNTGAVDPLNRPALEHYRAAGLLNAKTFAETPDFQLYAELPAINDTRRYIGSAGDGEIIVPFDLTPAMFADAANQNVAFHMGIVFNIGTKLAPGAKPPATAPATLPTTRKILGPTPLLSSTQPAGPPPGEAGPASTISILDSDETIYLDGGQFNGGQPNPLKPDEETSFSVEVSPDGINKLWAASKSPLTKRVFVAISGTSPSYLYYAAAKPCYLVMATQQQDGSISRNSVMPAVDPARNSEANLAIYRGGYSRYGQQIKGSEDGTAVAVYRFHNVVPTETADTVNFEMKLGVDRTGTETSDEADTITKVLFQIRNDKTGKITDPVTLQPETNRTQFFGFPTSAIEGGDFELIVRCTSPGQLIGMRASALQMVTDSGHFYFNLFKSLSIFWLLSVLVVSVAIFCSTFVSWPIAVVLCVVILLGRWGVEELGDSTRPGIGAQVATDFGFRDANQARVVSESVETLTKLLNTLSHVLPDISQFPATEDIERGVSIPHDKLWDALKESASFGLPLLLLGYVIFKNKEVAP